MTSALKRVLRMWEMKWPPLHGRRQQLGATNGGGGAEGGGEAAGCQRGLEAGGCTGDGAGARFAGSSG